MPTPYKNLITAAKRGDNEKVIELLEKGADLEASNQHGHTALICAAGKGHAAVVRTLVGAGAYLKASNQHGQTALHYAAGNGYLDIVKALMDARADADATSNHGDTALILAADKGHAAVVTALLEKRADPKATNDKGYTALHYAAGNGYLDIVKALMDARADADATSNHGNTALILAADKGHAAVVTALLEKRADPKATNDKGYTALICAAGRGHAAVVTALVQAGADPKAKDQYGNTALICAAYNGHAAVVTALVQAGADADATSNDGRTALHWARDHTGIVFEIEEYIKSGDYKWRQHLPYLKKAAWNYYNPDKTSITVGIANKVIPYFLHSISLPQKRLAFAKLFNRRLPNTTLVQNLNCDVLRLGSMLAAQPKIINVKITEIFAKIMAALVMLDEYEQEHRNPSNPFKVPDKARADAAKKVSDAILDLANRGETVISLKQIILNKHCSPQVVQAIFKPTNLGQGLTALQEKLEIIARWLNDGADYSTPKSFAGLKAKIEKDAATRIQSFFRGCKTRKALYKVKNSAAQLAQEPEPQFKETLAPGRE